MDNWSLYSYFPPCKKVLASDPHKRLKKPEANRVKSGGFVLFVCVGSGLRWEGGIREG